MEAAAVVGQLPGKECIPAEGESEQYTMEEGWRSVSVSFMVEQALDKDEQHQETKKKKRDMKHEVSKRGLGIDDVGSPPS